MNILDYALTMEKDGEQFYRRLAQESQGTGLRSIFTFLADAEAEHYDIVLRMKKDETPEVLETPILDQAKNVFAEMASTRVPDLIPPASTDQAVDLYRQAQEIEKKSMAFYAEKADEVEDGSHKDILLKLAEEEKRHFWIMYNLVEHVGRPDHNWIEFAEWHHMEEY